MEKVVIYSDGSCRGNPGLGGWGATIEREGAQKQELCGGEFYSTNNKMELFAIISALAALKEPSHVVAYLDSEYVLKGVTQWMDSWKRKGWRTAKKEPVKNIELWQTLDRLVSNNGHTFEWFWVKSHAGNPGNERADYLANLGATMVQEKAIAAARTPFFAEVYAKDGHPYAPVPAPIEKPLIKAFPVKNQPAPVTAEQLKAVMTPSPRPMTTASPRAPYKSPPKEALTTTKVAAAKKEVRVPVSKVVAPKAVAAKSVVVKKPAVKKVVAKAAPAIKEAAPKVKAASRLKEAALVNTTTATISVALKPKAAAKAAPVAKAVSVAKEVTSTRPPAMLEKPSTLFPKSSSALPVQNAFTRVVPKGVAPVVVEKKVTAKKRVAAKGPVLTTPTNKSAVKLTNSTPLPKAPPKPKAKAKAKSV